MLLAMPTDDRRTLAAHFGRAAEFAIFEIENGNARLVEFRPNRHVHHHGNHAGDTAQGPHGAENGHVHGHGHDFSDPLAGVKVLICSGFGARAREAVAAMGIEVLFAPGDVLVELAGRFARGELVSGDPACGHACNH